LEPTLGGVAALERGPETGVPDNPGAWLMATAKNGAINRLRRENTYELEREEVAHDTERSS
jgi:predicted RNA polymerase sigma factor